jgi:transmembrane sensor
MAPPNISPQLLEKYLNNTCSEEERALVEAWYASLQGKQDYLDTLPAGQQTKLQDETFENIQGQLAIDQEEEVREFPLRWITWLAASVLMVIGIYFTYNNNDVTPEVSIVRPIEKKETENIIHFVNNESRLVMHRLPDASTVWMHKNASIRYPKEFDADKRIVNFSGEGFFDITKDKSRPFSIQSGELVIKVLGTSFNVKAPVENKIFQVSVVTGRVEVSAPNKEQKQQLVVLKPQQEAFFETGSRRLVLSPVPVHSKKEIYESVTIVFKETPLNEAVTLLEKRFDIDIRLSNPEIGSCQVTGDFEKEPLPAIIEMLCNSLEASYTMSGKTITIDALPCK